MSGLVLQDAAGGGLHTGNVGAVRGLATREEEATTTRGGVASTIRYFTIPFFARLFFAISCCRFDVAKEDQDTAEAN
jgi:hypothetical protein